MKRPNILFLMSDEHRFDVSGFMGNDIVKTPNLDRLAKDAVIFDNAYAHNPICVPGRQCMLAGQMSTSCNVHRYGEDLAPGYQTFPRLLSQYGYNTVAAGKLHLTGVDQMQGFTNRFGCDAGVSPKFIKNMKEPYVRPKTEGFKWTQSKEVQKAGIGISGGARVDEYSTAGLEHYIWEKYINAYYDRHNNDQPVLLKLSLIQPHYPYFTDEKKFNYYLNRVKEYENKHREIDHDFLSRFPVDASERERQKMLACYYGMVETIDGLYGRILDRLEEVGEDLDNWIIVYTSDHGEMLGEHDIMEKQKFYEGSARIPLFIRYPKKFAPKRVAENVNNIDLFATLLELCSVPCENEVDSRSLVPLLDGDNSEWDNETICQFDGTNIMIKRDSLKYHYYKTSDTSFLWDLDRDPEENINYINEPEYQEFIAKCIVKKNELGFIAEN